MGIDKLRKICIYILAIFLIFSPIFVCNYYQNKTIIKQIKESKTKPLDQEGQTYRLVTSADNVQVPVPKGYVASNVTGENYVTPEYNHTTITHRGTYTELTWSSPAGEQYPWRQDENGIWISGNQGIPSSTSTIESEEFNYIKGTTLTINYTYSCEYAYNTDYLSIDLINITNNSTRRIVSIAFGNTSTSFDYLVSNYTYIVNDWGTGRYKIKAIYSKNGITNEGQDSAYIKASTYFKEDENETETFEEDIKTKIHDGGFVIYQLTDEEIEADPKGTSININDINKDIAQSTRNQYVWVPVENVEDIVRTKTRNNGIMQFGQGYTFSYVSITKETDIREWFYKEPRLEEQQDRTNYNLQKYAYMNEERENYLNIMQEDYLNMIKSINYYKGFYIGRYETGDDLRHNDRKGCFKKPKIVRYNSNINYVTWYNSYKDLERLSEKTEEYVKTGMLYDTIWDYTLKWLNETDTRSYREISEDSGIWGNYYNNCFKYRLSSNGTESTKNINSYIMAPTGGITEITYKEETYIDSPTASNNIFDIAGNVKEWTRSRSTGCRSYRGGYFNSYSSGYSSSDRRDESSISNSNYMGVRAQLYIL